jgi:hypothetical protein
MARGNKGQWTALARTSRPTGCSPGMEQESQEVGVQPFDEGTPSAPTPRTVSGEVVSAKPTLDELAATANFEGSERTAQNCIKAAEEQAANPQRVLRIWKNRACANRSEASSSFTVGNFLKRT